MKEIAIIILTVLAVAVIPTPETPYRPCLTQSYSTDNIFIMKNWFFITFVLFATSASAQIEWIPNFQAHGFHFNWNMVDSIAVIDSGRVYAPRRNNVYQVKVMSRAEAREVVLNLRQEIKNRENANLRLQNRLLKDAEALGNFEQYIQADTTGG